MYFVELFSFFRGHLRMICPVGLLPLEMTKEEMMGEQFDPRAAGCHNLETFM